MKSKIAIIFFLSITCLYANKDCKKVDPITSTNELIDSTFSLNLEKFRINIDGCDEKDIYELTYNKDGNKDLLDLTINNNYFPIVKYLLEKYPNFDFDKSRIFKYVDENSLNYIDSEMIDYLLDFGKLSINTRDENAKTLLHHVLNDPQTFEVKYFLEKGIDVNIKDNSGKDVIKTAEQWLLYNEQLYKVYPWEETQKRIQRIKKAIELIEEYKVEKKGY